MTIKTSQKNVNLNPSKLTL